MTLKRKKTPGTDSVTEEQAAPTTTEGKRKKTPKTGGKTTTQVKEQPTSAPSQEEEEAPEEAPSSSEERTVYVAGLSYDASQDDLKNYFEPCGEIVTVRFPRYADSGKPKGFAFLEFSTKRAALRAMAKDGQTMMNRYLQVTMATGAPPKQDPTYLDKPHTERPPGCRVVFVGNLAWDAKEDDVQSLFETCGKVESVRLAMEQATGRSRGFAYVHFGSEDAVDAAIAKTGTTLNGRQIRVDYASAKSEPSSSGRDREGRGRGGRGGRGGPGGSRGRGAGAGRGRGRGRGGDRVGETGSGSR